MKCIGAIILKVGSLSCVNFNSGLRFWPKDLLDGAACDCYGIVLVIVVLDFLQLNGPSISSSCCGPN
ncbi:hypothetical protein Patl1_00229 [Pistacia atlantica]|uniref:Uncharacterized protein n=1 Tax=Pistacia atlantica TaxID=434234 RepID=A0ACC1C564_9ROSI|nr:hypothetical protein Patl1_00229 [Pistacia atlantica]